MNEIRDVETEQTRELKTVAKNCKASLKSVETDKLPLKVSSVLLTNDTILNHTAFRTKEKGLITVFPDFNHYYYQCAEILNDLYSRKDVRLCGSLTPASGLILCGYALLAIIIESELLNSKMRTNAIQKFIAGPNDHGTIELLLNLYVPKKVGVILRTFLPSYGDPAHDIYFVPSLDTYTKEKDEQKLLPPWLFCLLHDKIAISNDRLKLDDIVSNWPAAGNTYDIIADGYDSLRRAFCDSLEDGNARYFNNRPISRSSGFNGINANDRVPVTPNNIYDWCLRSTNPKYKGTYRLMKGISNWLSQIDEGIQLKSLMNMNGNMIFDHVIMDSKVLSLDTETFDRKATGLAFSTASQGDIAIVTCGGKYVQFEHPVSRQHVYSTNSYCFDFHRRISYALCPLNPTVMLEDEQDKNKLKKFICKKTWSSYRYRFDDGDDDIEFVINVAGITDQPLKCTVILDYLETISHN